jgi:glycosyltransferase involved in cell wall biosynthesis
MVSTGIQKGYRVGIDLAPGGMGSRAPGTARHVIEQARALFQLDVPWTWIPLVEAESNPLFEEMKHLNLKPVVVTARKVWTRATFDVGRAWAENRCDLGFATATFVPLRGCKVVANFFDSTIYEYGWTWVRTGRRWNYYLVRFLSTRCVKRAERLFVNSHYCVEDLRKRFPAQASKFCCTSPGILPPMDQARETRPSALANPARPYCLFVGVFSENKNQRRLIEAWAQWQRIDPGAPLLVLVGRCDADYLSSAILPARKKAPRPEEIILTDFLSDEEVSWCYRHASIYLQPSFAEGFGLPILEAMSYGVPVATSNTTSLPEVGGDAAVYFHPGKVESILHVIRDLWSNPDKRRLLINQGHARPREYTWEKNARAVASQIDAVLADKS